jgi:hypothetical protein
VSYERRFYRGQVADWVGEGVKSQRDGQNWEILEMGGM